MPLLSDTYERVPCTSIIVQRDTRQRKALRIDEGFKKSIKEKGVLNPIIVQRDMVLVAGERRLTTSLELGLPDIPVRYADSLTPIEAQLIELEENIKRLDLDWPDLVRGVERIHKLYCQLDSEWTMGETAEACALSTGAISMYLRVASEIDSNERVLASGSIREAYNVLGRRDARAAGDLIQELLEVSAEVADGRGTGDGAADTGIPGTVTTPIARPYHAPQSAEPPAIPSPSDTILHTDAISWMRSYTGPRFNFIHFDPPYGVNFASGPQGQGHEERVYDDSDEVYWKLLEELCRSLDHIMALSGHLMLWTSASPSRVAKTLELFARLAPSLEPAKFPLIWTKSDNAGIASDPRQGPRHIYELALLFTRGKRQIVKIVSDSYQSSSDRTLHPSTKPEPMLRHFFSMLVDDHTDMLDPTCGSGASIRAAESLGARRCLGLEIDEQYVGPARKELHRSRLAREGAKAISRMGL